MTDSIPVITLDGPAASGKGTIAARVADALGFYYLDSGALYRIATLNALSKGIDLDDADALTASAEKLEPVFDGDRILLEGRDVTTAIRAEEVSAATSRVAAVPGGACGFVCASEECGSTSRTCCRWPRHGNGGVSRCAAQDFHDGNSRSAC